MPALASHATALADWVAALRGGRRDVLAFAAGAASVLAMAPFFLWPVLFVTLPILVWLIDGSQTSPATPVWRAAQASFRPSWWFGFGYFAAGLFWVGEAFLVEAEKFAWALPFAVTLLPAGLALFWGAAGAAAGSLWRRGFGRILVLALALAAAEWLRGHVLTGFPWNVLGYALTAPSALMQSASLGGVYTLTLWVVLIFATPLVVLADRDAARPSGLRRAGLPILASALPLAMLFAFGAWRLAQGPAPLVPNVKLRIVQPSVPQRDKWMPDKQREIFALHLDLSKRNPDGVVDDLAGITHLVWPEAAMPFRPLEHPEALDAIGAAVPAGTYLLSGGLRVAEAPEAGPESSGRNGLKAYNSLFVLGAGGRLAELYDKIHLVPFGEYLPFQATLEAVGLRQLTHLRGGFTEGVRPRPLLAIGALPPAAILICYEAIFPAAVVQGPDRPGLLVNVTNDGWFGNTTGPRQHFHQARVRAVEEGLPLIRAANNGISAVVDAEGRILASLDMNVRGGIDSVLPAARTGTFYSRFGDWILVLNMIVFLALLVGLGKQARATP